jgi:asparagine synthase (glutamine-hydrolysing)
MSIIFGIRKLQGATVSEEELLRLANATERYAPDGVAVHAASRVGMGFQPYYTHLRSRLESRPATDAHGNLLVFDGRLDNYQDLCRELELEEMTAPDSRIILALFLRWGEECFSRLIGDWALSLWSANSQSLYLARDHAGTRTLYFESRNNTLRWSTYLDSFFASARNTDVDEDYVACYLAAQPVRDLTPYKGIRSILPAHYVIVRDNNVSVKSHWNWMRSATIRYSSDEEYDEHFLELFGRAVARRDGAGAPIIAELSGGVDSSSIVCMSDRNRRKFDPKGELLDTISYYDDSEPGWDEKPYFSIVEKQRGKTGIHIDTSSMVPSFAPHSPSQGQYFLPGPDSATPEQESKIQSLMEDRGCRSILSGIGGDEVLGGVPSPQTNLTGYMAAGAMLLLLTRATEWCLTDRSPLALMLWETAGLTLSLYRQPAIAKKSFPSWIRPAFQGACARRVRGDVTGGSRFGLSPVSISNGLAWWSIMETLPHTVPGLLSRPEYRYPFLDRELIEFLFGIPRDQLSRPGRRRLMMRRALKGVVPGAILERRRKAYLARGPIVEMRESKDKINLLLRDSILGDRGMIEPDLLLTGLDRALRGEDSKWTLALLRAISLELWLRGNTIPSKTEGASPSHPNLLLSTTRANKIHTIRIAG